MNIQESIKKRVYEKVVNEIDWENQFSDVKKSCIPPDALVKDLQAVLDRAALPSNKRGKLPMNKAIVHKNSVPQTEEGEVDVKAFIDDITTFPNKLISQNGKMEKTSKGNAWVVNTGIPALRGIVYDEDGGKFYTVNTCPGAGGCRPATRPAGPRDHRDGPGPRPPEAVVLHGRTWERTRSGRLRPHQ